MANLLEIMERMGMKLQKKKGRQTKCIVAQKQTDSV